MFPNSMCCKTIFHVKLFVCFVHFRVEASVEASVEDEEDVEEEGDGGNSSDLLQSDADLSVSAAHCNNKKKKFAISVCLPDTLRISTSLRVILVL